MTNSCSRRAIVGGALTLFATPPPLRAIERCRRRGPYDDCRVFVDEAKVRPVVALKKMRQWCWAATLETIFSSYGYEIPQYQIIWQTYGRIENIPERTAAMLSSINKKYKDRSGRVFQVQTLAHDLKMGSKGVISREIVRNIANDHPMIICGADHMMTLIGGQFLVAGGHPPSFYRAAVFDPWPGNGHRELTARELYGSACVAAVII